MGVRAPSLPSPAPSTSGTLDTSSFVMHHKGGFHKKEKAITLQVLQKITDISEVY